MRIHVRKSRNAFTIIELLVAAGVAMLLMLIITEAFKRGIDMFRSMRAQGNMQERLRTAGTAMRDDLAAHHLPGSTGITQYISFLTSDDNWLPPQDGFLRIYQGTMDAAGNPFTVEGTDPDGMLCTRATTHILHFSVFRKGTSPDNMFRTVAQPPLGSALGVPSQYIDPPDYGEALPQPIFSSRWAEVAYFLRPNGDNANGTMLFNLHRRAKLLIPSTNVAPAVSNVPVPAPPPSATPPVSPNPDISFRTVAVGNSIYNTTHDVTRPYMRSGMWQYATAATDPRAAGIIQPGFPLPGYIWPNVNHRYSALQDPWPDGFGPNSALAGDDVILSNVISFEVKALWTPNAATATFPTPDLPANRFYGAYTNSDYPFDYLPRSNHNTQFDNTNVQNPRVFDTWAADDIYAAGWSNATPSPVGIPLRINLKAVLIRIRIWDAKAEQARQLTIIQDL
jgi:type II secretory pathway pseudopilin PulG